MLLTWSLNCANAVCWVLNVLLFVEDTFLRCVNGCPAACLNCYWLGMAEAKFKEQFPFGPLFFFHSACECNYSSWGYVERLIVALPQPESLREGDPQRARVGLTIWSSGSVHAGLAGVRTLHPMSPSVSPSLFNFVNSIFAGWTEIITDWLLYA